MAHAYKRSIYRLKQDDHGVQDQSGLDSKTLSLKNKEWKEKKEKRKLGMMVHTYMVVQPPRG